MSERFNSNEVKNNKLIPSIHHKDEVKRQEKEREKFYALFNIFVHEIKHVNPELFPSCLEIEAMMNEAFEDKEKHNCI